jgi:hypothetical protein
VETAHDEDMNIDFWKVYGLSKVNQCVSVEQIISIPKLETIGEHVYMMCGRGVQLISEGVC